MERTASVVLTESEANQLLQHLDVSVKHGGLQNAITAVVLAGKISQAFKQDAEVIEVKPA